MTLEDTVTSPSHVHGGVSLSWTHANDQACFSLMDPDRTCNLEGLEKTDFWTLRSQSKTVDPMKGNLIMLLDYFYYGKHTKDGQPDGKSTLLANTATASFPPYSSSSFTLKVSTLPGSPPQSVKSVNCPLNQIRFSDSTCRKVTNLVKCPMCAVFAMTDCQPLLTWRHILECDMETRTICFVCCASDFSNW